MLPHERVRREAELRAAVLAGDAGAWRTLYDAAFAGLWAYAVWRCAGLDDLAEEITQETWLVAVRRIGDFDPGQAPFQAWLRGIAARVLQSHWRTLRRHPEEPLAGRDVAESSTAGHEQRDQAELIARSLALLPERHELVLRLKYLDRQSVEHIAADWSQTPKAIESLLTRTRQSFRSVYEKLAGKEVLVKEPES